MSVSNIEILEFNDSLAAHFYRLNAEWLQRYFHLEPVDHEVLGDPASHIIAPGGVILFAQVGGRVVGTCALMPKSGLSGHFELTKMAVTAQFQGQGLGRALLREIIGRFKGLEGRLLFLETSSRLHGAIHLYESAGFRAAPRPGIESAYRRADVYMLYAGECAPSAPPRSQVGASP
jgi:ribosomal protein S18 acetylase RimI-like enzyme